MEIYRATEYPSKDVAVKLSTEDSEGVKRDTNILLTGNFCISWQNKDEFLVKLGGLIDEYRI